jgi:energy-coupling factor transporter ATP-binding protein EcfA2
MAFTIICIHPIVGCKYLKILKEGEYYFFNDWYREENGHIIRNEDNTFKKGFFGNGITIQAVVGKNGSGKSSLLELIYRILNNFSYVTTEGVYRAKAERLYYIKGIKAELYFELDGQLGCVKVEDDTVTFVYGENNPLELYFPGSKNYEETDGWLNAIQLDGFEYDAIRGMERRTIGETIEKTLNHFFYSLVVNYSIQSLNPCDYEYEEAYGEDADDWADNSWLTSLYRKNDGYMVPIGFEPYRGNNQIDLVNQKELAEDRVAALLIDAEKHGHKLLPGYSYSSIDFTYDQKFSLRFDHPAEDGDISTDAIQKIAEDLNSERSNLFFEFYGIDEGYKQNDFHLFKRAFMYLIDKTFSVSRNYPDYEDYSELSDAFFDLEHKLLPHEKDMVVSLIEKVKKEPSHIGVKVHQTLHFLERLIYIDEAEQSEMNNNGFSYEEYIQQFFPDMNIEGPKTIMEYYPPPIFRNYIYLKNDMDQECIEFPLLSSGERQYLFMLSAYLYHLRNIISVPEDAGRVKYHNVCLFLDEIELCFHPEYQRLFVANLLQSLKDNKVTESVNVNVVLTTHSPFVLSDIPQSNILYLENGEDVKEQMKVKTFASNINELLAESFFLNGGFVGEFACQVVNDLTSFLLGKQHERRWDMDSADQLIETVGDDVVKIQLRRLFIRKFGKNNQAYKMWVQKEFERLGLNQENR